MFKFSKSLLAPITETKFKLALTLLAYFLSGCSNSHYAKTLLAENNNTKWSSRVSPKEKVWETLNYCNYQNCKHKAVIFMTSGFHFENYVVFEKNRAIVTIAFGDRITKKGVGRYSEVDLTLTMNKLEQQGECSVWEGALDNIHGDFIAYRKEKGIYLCFEENGYWNNQNFLHGWFWNTYGKDIEWSYSE